MEPSSSFKNVYFDAPLKGNPGGQGEIWEGHLDDGTKVAIKIPLPSPNSDHPDDDRRRFEREIRCQTTLNHPGIVRVLGTGFRDADPFYVMKIADCSLRDRLRDPHDVLMKSDGVQLFTKVVEAMAHAHSEGILHRDLKPENILLYNNEPKLADFGLGRQISSESATLTVTNTRMGTLEYMPPEQYRDAHSATTASDVYSLGKIFYEILTGKIPFPTVDETEIPSEYQYTISKCLNNDPNRRYRDANELLNQLKLVKGGHRMLGSPAGAARAAITQIQNGDHDLGADRLAETLLQNKSDSTLYLDVVARLEEQQIDLLLQRNTHDFESIVYAFLEFVDGRHPFSFTDIIANFLLHCFRKETSVLLRSKILEETIQLAYSHNRFHVGDVFVDMVKESMDDQHFCQAIVDVIIDFPIDIAFVRDELLELSLPPAVRDALMEPPF